MNWLRMSLNVIPRLNEAVDVYSWWASKIHLSFQAKIYCSCAIYCQVEWESGTGWHYVTAIQEQGGMPANKFAWIFIIADTASFRMFLTFLWMDITESFQTL